MSLVPRRSDATAATMLAAFAVTTLADEPATMVLIAVIVAIVVGAALADIWWKNVRKHEVSHVDS